MTETVNINFAKDGGMVAGIVQDAKTGEVFKQARLRSVSDK